MMLVDVKRMIGEKSCGMNEEVSVCGVQAAERLVDPESDGKVN